MVDILKMRELIDDCDAVIAHQLRFEKLIADALREFDDMILAAMAAGVPASNIVLRMPKLSPGLRTADIDFGIGFKVMP